MGHNKIQKFQLLGCVNFCICHYFHEKSTILKLVLTYDFYSLFWYLVWILALKWLDSKSLVLWPSESPSYDYMHWKFLIFIQSTYFSHLMITSGGAVQFAKTLVTLGSVFDKHFHSATHYLITVLLLLCEQSFVSLWVW